MYRIKIIEVAERQTKDGRKFKIFRALSDDGKRIDCKFRQAVKNLPEHPCFVLVPSGGCNVSTAKEYPVLWISEVLRYEEIARRDNTAEYFAEIDEESGEIQ